MKKAIASIALSMVVSLAVSAQTKEILSLKGSEGKLYAELQRPATGKATALNVMKYYLPHPTMCFADGY